MATLLDPNKYFDRYISIKPKNAFPQPVLEEVKRLQIQKAAPFGSYILRIQEYPGDIDLIEYYQKCCSKKDVAISFVSKFKRIVRDIIKQRKHYYSEVKAGLDKRYMLNIGTLKNGIYIPAQDLILNLIALKNVNLLSGKEIKNMFDILRKKRLNSDDYDVIHYMLRKHYILRWSAKEVLDGHKILPGNKKISLEVAVTQPTVLKIDEISFIETQIYEITNIYFLGYTEHKNGELHQLTFNNPYVELPKEIEKLFYSNMWYSPFKAVKRMFAFSRLPKNKNDPRFRNILKKLFPFISGDISKLYQIKSQLATIERLYGTQRSIPIASINEQLYEIQSKLASVIYLSKEELDIFEEGIIKLIKLVQRNDKRVVTKNLEMFIDELTKQINSGTIYYLNKVGLNPIPSFILPDNHSYDRNIQRKESSNPKNPLDKYEGGCLECMLDY